MRQRDSSRDLKEGSQSEPCVYLGKELSRKQPVQRPCGRGVFVTFKEWQRSQCGWSKVKQNGRKWIIQGPISHYEDLGFYSEWLREPRERANSRRMNALNISLTKLCWDQTVGRETRI